MSLWFYCVFFLSAKYDNTLIWRKKLTKITQINGSNCMSETNKMTICVIGFLTQNLIVADIQYSRCDIPISPAVLL